MGAVDAVEPGLRLRGIAIADDLLEVLQTCGVDDGELAVFQTRLRLTRAQQPLDVGIGKLLPARCGERVAHLEPILTRADDLELRRDALDVACPLLDLRGERHLPFALQPRAGAGEEPHHLGLPVQDETAGIRPREADLLEPRDRRVFRGSVPQQHALCVLRIAEDKLVLRIRQRLDRHAIAVGAEELGRDAVECSGDAQLERRRGGGDLWQANAISSTNVERLAQPRQVEREEVQRALGLEL